MEDISSCPATLIRSGVAKPVASPIPNMQIGYLLIKSDGSVAVEIGNSEDKNCGTKNSANDGFTITIDTGVNFNSICVNWDDTPEQYIGMADSTFYDEVVANPNVTIVI